MNADELVLETVLAERKGEALHSRKLQGVSCSFECRIMGCKCIMNVSELVLEICDNTPLKLSAFSYS